MTACLAVLFSLPLLAATPDEPVPIPSSAPEQHWRVDGGTLSLRFNDEFLDLFGISQQIENRGRGAHLGYVQLGVWSEEGLRFNAPEGSFDRFLGGSLQLEGGPVLQLPGGDRIDLRDGMFRVAPDNPMRLELVDADGAAWLYLNHLMYKILRNEAFIVRSADLRASARLAERVGAPALADAYVGEVRMELGVVEHGGDWRSTLLCADPNFHGEPTGSGTDTYAADVLMENYSMSFSRCRRSNGTNGCDGAGPDDGEVVFTPSSTLRNSNRSNTADVPWYEKFTTSPYDYPYPGNDQHPYLIWNLYRIVDDQLEQIGASGVKHAFLTINSGCASGACTGGGHILGRNCGDTYGTGNNDSNSDLGPRHEVIPSTGQFGRCGSIFDPDCDGTENGNGNTSYSQRLVVRESQLLVLGAQFYSESWYIVQEDIDIYNTMAHRTMAPQAGGGGWIPGAQGPFRLGPVIDTWVDPAAFPARNVSHHSQRGHAKVAVKVKQLPACPAGSGLSGTCYRWDYVVANFDWSDSVTSGTPPDLKVEKNQGFGAFSVQVPGATSVFLEPGGHFADIDTNPANNWSASIQPGRVQWQAPDGNSLDWGLLFRFSLIATRGADDTMVGTATLTSAGDPLVTPSVNIMVPGLNSPPEVAAPLPDLAHTEGDSVAETVAGSFTEPDGEALSYAATGLPPGVSIDATSGALTGELGYFAAGSYTTTIIARDSWGAETSQAFQWEVANLNRSPEPVGSVPPQQALEREAISLDLAAAFADPDNEALSFEATGLPPGVVIGTDGVLSGAPANGSAGNYASVVTATDPHGASAEQAVDWIIIEDNTAPLVVSTLPDQHNTEGDSVHVDTSAAFFDEDGDALSWSAANLPPGLAIDPATGVVTGTLGNQAAGGYFVTITATDPDGSAASEPFTWIVLDGIELGDDVFGNGFETDAP